MLNICAEAGFTFNKDLQYDGKKRTKSFVFIQPQIEIKIHLVPE
jgi:hypothetical protein